jgi:molybdopterin synthase catalytic subunit
MAQDSGEISELGCFVGLTQEHLDVVQLMDRVRSPKAGAIVIFAGLSQILRTFRRP